MSLLEVSELKTYFYTMRGKQVIRAVDGVSFSMESGEALGLVGESGCGKTTTALSIVRALPPAARVVGGVIRLDGEDLLVKTNSEMRKVRGRKVGMILQDPTASLNPVFSVGEQVAEPVRWHMGLRKNSLSERVKELLAMVRIPSPEIRMREYPHQMSGGMRQRIAGAIALAAEPKIIIADEPTTNLDVSIQAQYLQLLRQIQENTGTSLLFITHNLGIVAKMCHRVAVMYAGRIVEQAPVRELFNNPNHPYTRALLQAVPRIGVGSPVCAIPGQPPDLANLPSGCSFFPRCSEALEHCQHDVPTQVCLGNDHFVSCWKVNGGRNG